MKRALMAAVVLAVALPGVAGTEEPVDLAMVTRIRDQAFHRSQVMEIVGRLTDVIGPRLTGSPQMKQANEWTREALAGWGLQNAHLESWGPFGEGWTLEHSSIRMVAPSVAELHALPEAWTPGTAGAVRGPAVRVKLESEADLEAQKGKLAGKVLLLDEPRELTGGDEPDLSRYSEKDLQELSLYQPPSPRRRERILRYLKRRAFRKKLNAYLEQEKVLAVIKASRRDDGVLAVQGGGSRVKGEPRGVPSLVMAIEPCDRLVRLLDRKLDVELELDVAVRFNDDDPMAYNTVAEIPGTGKEIVMLGGHLDSWHAGTGATDNAAGSAVALEAIRILARLGVKPRRTIRIALWSGEEQGLLGSQAYVAQHFATLPEPTDPEQKALPAFFRRPSGPPNVKPDYDRLSAYFNLDNGTGKIRGVYLQENLAVRPIFEAWLAPFADLGATTLTARNTGGTDHLSFDRVGLPGFQFIQDEVEYETLTHHTDLDVYDHLKKQDLMQASAILASFVYDAAMRAERLPRKPLPQPEPTPPAAPAGGSGS